MRKLFDVTDVVDDVQGVVDETVQRTTDNLHQVRNTFTWCHCPTCDRRMSLAKQAVAMHSIPTWHAGCIPCSFATSPPRHSKVVMLTDTLAGPCDSAGNNNLMAHRQAHIGQRGCGAHEPAALLQPSQRRQPAGAAVLGGLGARLCADLQLHACVEEPCCPV